MKEKLKKLDELEALWRKCEACPLAQQRSRVVMWRGSPNGRLFIVGEAPGREEDQHGIPFVGASGRRLDALLVRAGLGADDVFIANMVGCRPPGNRAPSPEELKACRGRLDALLAVVQPAALLVLGRTAARLAGIRSIQSWRGTPTTTALVLANGDIHEWPTIATYHPAYLLRNGDGEAMASEMVKDMEQARHLAYG